MSNNILLTICIPTYNRLPILKEALEDLQPKITDLPIKILVIDNASTDETSAYLKGKKGIVYIENETNIGGDNNILKCYLEASKFSDYICVLGDSYRFEGDLNLLIEKIQLYTYDVVFLNRLKNNTKYSSNMEFCDLNDFAKYIGGLSDLVGCIVIKSTACQEKYFKNYLWSNFIHVGMMFSYLADKVNMKAFFLSDIILTHTHLVKVKASTSWYKNTLNIFVYTWFFVILSLPSINQVVKLKIIKDHSELTRLFGISSLLKLRICGGLKVNEVFAYRKYYPFVTNTSPLLIYLLALLPLPLVKFIDKSKEIIKKWIK